MMHDVFVPCASMRFVRELRLGTRHFRIRAVIVYAQFRSAWCSDIESARHSTWCDIIFAYCAVSKAYHIWIMNPGLNMLHSKCDNDTSLISVAIRCAVSFGHTCPRDVNIDYQIELKKKLRPNSNGRELCRGSYINCKLLRAARW